MTQAVGGLITGAKVAIFLLAIIYSYLAHLRMKDFEFSYIGATAASFLLISMAEFLVILEEQAGVALFTWMVNLTNQVFFTDTLFLIAGITTFMFLRSVKQDSE